MSIHYEPIVTVNVNGSDISTYENISTFKLSQKVEEIYSIKKISSPQSVVLSNITNNKVLMFSSDSAFDISIVRTITSPLGETFDHTLVIPNRGGTPTILNITQAWLDGTPEVVGPPLVPAVPGIKSIYITTSSVALIKVKLTALGLDTTV